jgi:hypothetical protein
VGSTQRVRRGSAAHQMADSDSNIDKSESKNVNKLVEIISDVQGYLYNHLREYLGGAYADTSNFLKDSSKFQELKKLNFYWKLNEKYSFEYYEDVNYRTRLDFLLTDS